MPQPCSVKKSRVAKMEAGWRGGWGWQEYAGRQRDWPQHMAFSLTPLSHGADPEGRGSEEGFPSTSRLPRLHASPGWWCQSLDRKNKLVLRSTISRP